MNESLKFTIKDSAVEGILNGSLDVVGSVVRYISGKNKGTIHSHLQPTTASEMAQKAVLMGDSLKHGQEAMQKSLEGISGGVKALKSMQGLNLALSLADIGVSIAGFAMMNAKLNAVQHAIHEVSEELRLINQDAIDRDFLKLKALVEQYENTWHISDQSITIPILINIANEASEGQLLFQRHAERILRDSFDTLPAADCMLDGMAVTLGLRVSAALAANESGFAQHIADQGSRRIEMITGHIGHVDIVRRQKTFELDIGSSIPDAALIASKQNNLPVLAKFRMRESNAATRSAIIPVLKEQGIMPRDWLAAARAEQSDPLIFLAH